MMAPFGVTLLITVALGFRSVHGWEAVNIWWINFLPVCAMLYLRSAPPNLKLAQVVASILTYIPFHLYYIGIHGLFDGLKPLLEIARSDFEFWPISLISFIIVTSLTYIELKNGNRHNV